MRPILTLSIIALLPITAWSQPGFYDRFDTPGATPLDDTNDPTDLGFHALQGAPALQVNQVQGRGGVLSASLFGSTGARNIYASENFEPVHLVPQSHVTLGFSMRATAQPGPGGLDLPTFAFGLHDSNFTEVQDGTAGSHINSLDDKGYHLFLNASDTLHSAVQRDFFAPRLDVESGRHISPFNFADGQWHDFRFVLRDEGETSFITFDLYIDGTLHATDDFLQRGVFRFDALHFGLIQGAMDMELDDIFVSSQVVPTPGSLALLTLGAAFASRRKQRH